MSTVGQRIKSRRIEMGLSADDLARKLGKNRATIYRYESDEIENLSIQLIAPLAEALQVSPAYLMGWTDEKPAIQKDSELSELLSKASDIDIAILTKIINLDETDKEKALSYCDFLAENKDK